MKKVSLTEPNVELNGMPWYKHNGDRLWRLPHEIENQLSKALWQVSKNTSGGRIRFRSDTTMLGMLVDFFDIHSCSSAVCKISRMGIDVYVDGNFWSSIVPERDGINEGVFFENAERKMREYTIYLPNYHHVDVKKILLDDFAEIVSPAPFAAEKPIVFYGTSITQGGSASRSALSYQALLCRDLNLDFVNLGFSGLGRGDLPIAKAMTEIDAACYVLDFAQNSLNVRELRNAYYPFIAEIRNKKPETPIIVTTPITYTAEHWNIEFQQSQEQKRQVIRDAYHKRVDEGDKNIYLAEWKQLISFTDGDGQVDGAHPNDIGFLRMSEGLKDIVKHVLKR